METVSDNLLELIKNSPVEWKKLEEVFILRNGYTPSKANKDYWKDGDVPWFRMEDLRTNGSVLSSAIQKVHHSGVKGKLFSANSLIMATTATIGEHALITVDYLCNQQFTNFTIKDEFIELLNNKFVYYYFYVFDEIAKNNLNQSSMPSVQMSVLKKADFPIPPLEIQEKIVEFLDKMTKYVTELTAELTLRKQQYNYYRDKLFSEDELVKVGFEKKTLGEVGEFIRGNGMQKKDFVAEGFPAIHYGQIYTKYGLEATETFTFVSDELAKKLKKAKMNDLIIATTSENIEDVGKSLVWSGDFEVAIGGHSCVYFSDVLNSKFLAYYMKTNEFQKAKMKKCLGTKVIELYPKNLATLKIPIPPLSEQARIVTILDKFDTLIHSVSEGLPKEIKLRQKQYEYYRELLLGFSQD
ncbi:MAG: restriction endonuclease subunit S [Defluviitaleaceae bacterium]|nr:restriction endonuclease subunit S [Defluviitaleaceae bacterium]